MLYDLVRNGEYVSEFSSEKVCYFLQKFGAENIFKLNFSPNFYGPYSGKVRYILNVLNGSYIMGYSDMSQKPFAPLTILADGYETVKNYVENDEHLSQIANKTIKFLTGFYSDFALELLSSIDYISTENNTFEKKIILQKLAEWSNRKRSLFSNDKHIEVIINHLKKHSSTLN